MHRTVAALGALLIVVFASSCNSQQATQEGTGYQTQATEPSTAMASTSADRATFEEQPTTGASTTPPAGLLVDPSSPEGAIQVVRDYYDAINEREYERAYNHWDRNGSASGQTLEQFEQGFAETKHVEVQIEQPGREDAAAGSLFIEVPVTITATTNDERTQGFSGTYSLRRVNDVPGATKEQLTWHIYAANITETDSSG